MTWEADQFWAQLTDPEKTDLRSRGTLKRWRRDEVLFHEHDRSDWVVVLMAGQVKVATSPRPAGRWCSRCVPAAP